MFPAMLELTVHSAFLLTGADRCSTTLETTMGMNLTDCAMVEMLSKRALTITISEMH